jgi:hypothetical protein
MKPAVTHCLLVGALAIAGCTSSQPASDSARQAEMLQRAVPSAIDCGHLAAARPVEIDAKAALGPGSQSVPVGPELRVRLRELHAVAPLVAPGRAAQSGERFAGHVPIRVEASGIYTVLVASLAWADLATGDPARRVEPLSFEWVTVCARNYKSGLYALERDKGYFLQLWDSPDRELALLVRQLR